MSDVLFPELPGLEWDLTKAPSFNTKIMTSINGRELRASYQAIPKYDITLSFGFLRESKGRTELQQLEGFFLERRGAFDSFLLKMPDDHQFDCTYIGDGYTSIFQLYKNMHTAQIPLSHSQSFSRPVNPLMWNKRPVKSMWDGNAQKPMWNKATAGVTKNGQVILSEPLEDGQTMSISGTYYYRCRFKDDEQQYTNFMYKLWKANKVQLVGSLGNKL
ncbi:DUF2460 domain-containing protein [Acinetobacter larvae]|uniref:DUF2460 domain-containing protein n=1 Tax=Acinetobacter larvae TaxID=1789224 RepID=A0A1B2LZD5_9GAMM|nr:DUF2460 domain-containing protein [Acinetobacter larvae]AOA58281.1 hypothetical protein BFG52_07865 [Acinetobacter larvae]